MAEKCLSQKREEVDIRDLVVSLECGGSDATSGIGANPLVGWVSDRIISLGATAILSETPEMIGEHTVRRELIGVGEKITEIVKDVESRERQCDARRSAWHESHTGEHRGGPFFDRGKVHGLPCKGWFIESDGGRPLRGIPKSRGLVIMDTPGFDVE